MGVISLILLWFHLGQPNLSPEPWTHYQNKTFHFSASLPPRFRPVQPLTVTDGQLTTFFGPLGHQPINLQRFQPPKGVCIDLVSCARVYFAAGDAVFGSNFTSVQYFKTPFPIIEKVRGSEIISQYFSSDVQSGKTENGTKVYAYNKGIFYVVSGGGGDQKLIRRMAASIKSGSVTNLDFITPDNSWVNYTNSLNRYSFKYPPYWTISDDGLHPNFNHIQFFDGESRVYIEEFTSKNCATFHACVEEYLQSNYSKILRQLYVNYDDQNNFASTNGTINFLDEGMYFFYRETGSYIIHYSSNPLDGTVAASTRAVEESFKIGTVDPNLWRTYKSRWGFQIQLPERWTSYWSTESNLGIDGAFLKPNATAIYELLSPVPSYAMDEGTAHNDYSRVPEGVKFFIWPKEKSFSPPKGSIMLAVSETLPYRYAYTLDFPSKLTPEHERAFREEITKVITTFKVLGN